MVEVYNYVTFRNDIALLPTLGYEAPSLRKKIAKMYILYRTTRLSVKDSGMTC